MTLTTSTRQLGNVLVIDCAGAIVYGEGATELRKRVAELLAQNPQVVLNLSEVTYVDSNGIGTFVSLKAAAQRAGGDLKLAALGPRLKDVLEVAKLNTLFGMYDSAEDAAAALAR